MTESDIELLKMAAKAAGYEVEFDPNGTGLAFNHEGSGPQSWAEWNPLTDDGDALRLAGRLKIDILFVDNEHEPSVVAERRWGKHPCGALELVENGEDVAVRRAVVRVAAYVGEFMP